MKINKRHFFTTICAVLLSACSAKSANENPVPAVLVESSISNTRVISNVMSKALNGTKVSLEKNAFLLSHRHVLEKKPFRDLNSTHADGLLLDIPKIESFTLFKQGESCFLKYDITGQTFNLKGIKCKQQTK